MGEASTNDEREVSEIATRGGQHPIRVGVIGAAGRMGSEVCRAVSDADDLELVAGLDSGSSLEELELSNAQVVVDFTRPDAVMETLRWCVVRGFPVVVGTSGFDEARLDELRGWMREATEKSPVSEGPIAHRSQGDQADAAANIMIVPNFCIGAVLAMRFAEQAARFYDSVEILEQHHPGKVDAPSGTAIRTAELIASARRDVGLPPMPDATQSALDGARGAKVDGIPIHAMRMAGLVAHQEVWFGSPGETLTIRHDSYDRAAYMPGVLLAIRQIRNRSGLTIGLDELLGL